MYTGKRICISAGDGRSFVNVSKMLPDGGVEVLTDYGERMRFDNRGKGWYVEPTVDFEEPWFINGEGFEATLRPDHPDYLKQPV
jgi:hypothetical protein